MAESSNFDELLTEARRHPIRGWDFSWLDEGGRFQQEPLPWDYSELVKRRIRRSRDFLDLGTGGGELLASLGPHPPRTLATESYGPNVRVAARRLAPLGIQVIHTWAAVDNNLQQISDPRGALPFRDGSFHLVVDRNEAFVAGEVARVLAPGGVFLTEQSGSAEIPEFYRLFAMEPPVSQGPAWNLTLAREQLVAAGLKPLRSGEANFSMSFRDVGALAWYLTAIPWVLPGFSVVRYRSRLERLHSLTMERGPIRIPRYAFWLEGRKLRANEPGRTGPRGFNRKS